MAKYKSYKKDVMKELDKRIERTTLAIGEVGKGYIKANTPVDSGNLRSSNEYTTKGSKTIFYNNTKYAPYVHEGTSKQSAQPFMKDAIYNNKNKFKRLAEKYLGSD